MPSRHLEKLASAPSSLTPTHTSKSLALIVGTALAGCAVVLISILILIFILRRLHKISKTSPSDAPLLKLQRFSYRELKRATGKFSAGSRVGQGGFGTVYRGVLRNGKVSAVKRLDTSSFQGERELQNEISVIGNLNSPHIVGLLGFCIHGRRRLLVYEFMENRSLQEALFDENYPVKLDWIKRFKIIHDTANALAFLHNKCTPPIIHGDIKPSNILLDDGFAARISDFGLARLKSEISAEDVLDQELMERETLRRDRIAARRKMKHRNKLESLKRTNQEQINGEIAKSPTALQSKELYAPSRIPAETTEKIRGRDPTVGDVKTEDQTEEEMEASRYDEAKPPIKSPYYPAVEHKSGEGEDDDSSKVSPSPHEEETEGDNTSKISQSEECRSEISQDSGLELNPARRNPKMLQKKKSSRDWWWKQESGDFSLKDFIVDWVACDVSREEPRGRDWSWADEKSVDGVSRDGKSDHRRKPRKGARSGSLEWWAECDNNSTEFKKRVKRQQRHKHKSMSNQRETGSEEVGKGQWSSREWWKDESSGEINKRSRELKKLDLRSRETQDTSIGEASFSFSHDGDQSQRKDSGRHLGRRRIHTQSRDWWIGELSRGREWSNGEGLSRQERNFVTWGSEVGEELCQVKEDTSWERKHDRSRSRSRDWWNGDVISRSGVSSTPSMRGTICYVAPEYGGGGILSEKSDVYSFGVLMLVIVSGRRPLQVVATAMSEFERANLISWARHAASAGRILDIVDANLHGEYSKDQASLCISLALLCLQRLPAVRPTMVEVARILTGQVELPQLPLEFSPSPPAGLSPYKSSRKVSNDHVSIDCPLLP